MPLRRRLKFLSLEVKPVVRVRVRLIKDGESVPTWYGKSKSIQTFKLPWPPYTYISSTPPPSFPGHTHAHVALDRSQT